MSTTTAAPVESRPIAKDTPKMPRKTPGVFQPERVGQVGYPGSLAAYEGQLARLRENARRAKEAGLLTRKDTRNGRRGERAEVLKEREADHVRACRLVDLFNFMNPNPAQLAAYVPCDEPDADLGDSCLAAIVGIAISATYSPTDRLTAARAALPYLRPLPSNRAAITLEGALAFLDALAAEGPGVDCVSTRPTTKD